MRMQNMFFRKGQGKKRGEFRCRNLRLGLNESGKKVILDMSIEYISLIAEVAYENSGLLRWPWCH